MLDNDLAKCFSCKLFLLNSIYLCMFKCPDRKEIRQEGPSPECEAASLGVIIVSVVTVTGGKQRQILLCKVRLMINKQIYICKNVKK